MCTAGWVGLRFCWCCFLLLLLLREGVSFCLLLLQGGVIFLLLLRWGVSCLGCGAFLLLLWGGACCFFCCCSAGESLFLLLLWVCLFVAAAFAVAAGGAVFLLLLRGSFWCCCGRLFLLLLRRGAFIFVAVNVFGCCWRECCFWCCCGDLQTQCTYASRVLKGSIWALYGYIYIFAGRIGSPPAPPVARRNACILDLQKVHTCRVMGFENFYTYVIDVITS